MEKYVKESVHYGDISAINTRLSSLNSRINNTEYLTTQQHADINYHGDMLRGFMAQLEDIQCRLKAIEERTGINYVMPTSNDVITFLRSDN